MKSKKKIILIVVVVILVIGAIVGGNYLHSVNKYQDKIKNMTITDVDISTIADGTYKGECDVDFIRAKVEVTVKSGVIEKIDLVEHYNDRGEKAEVIVDEIVNQQKVTVDAVSGATNSSKVIKKAVEDALLKADKKE